MIKYLLKHCRKTKNLLYDWIWKVYGLLLPSGYSGVSGIRTTYIYNRGDTAKERLGKKGENIAATFLKKKKYKILGRNVALFQGELDIVAKDEDCVVFVEVRTRKSAENGQPYELAQKKRKKVASLGKSFIKIHQLYDVMYRFDIISILLPDETTEPQITHIENAFDENGNLT